MHTYHLRLQKSSGPGCQCISCNNAIPTTTTTTTSDLHELEVTDIMNEPSDSLSTDESDDDTNHLDTRTLEEDTDTLLLSVFGEDDDIM